MTLNPVKITLQDNGDYKIELNHDALKDIDISFSDVPDDKRGGVARAFLSASALYCMAGSVNYLLRVRDVEVIDLTGSVQAKMGKDSKGNSFVESLTLDIEVDVPDDNLSELERCISYLEDGCLVTKSLKKGIKITHNIKKK